MKVPWNPTALAGMIALKLCLTKSPGIQPLIAYPPPLNRNSVKKVHFQTFCLHWSRYPRNGCLKLNNCKAFYRFQNFNIFFRNTYILLNFEYLVPCTLDIIVNLQFGIPKEFKSGICHKTHFIFGRFKNTKPWKHLHQSYVSNLIATYQFHRSQKDPGT